MRGVRGIAEQHDIVVGPVSVAHGRKVPPHGLVLEQPMPAELGGEQPLAEIDGFILAGAVEASILPSGFGGFDDEGRMLLIEAVGVHPPKPVLGFPKQEGEGIEMPRRAEPDEFIRAPIELRPELGSMQFANSAVDAVRAEDEVGIAISVEIANLDAVDEFDAERCSTSLQDVEQYLARQP